MTSSAAAKERSMRSVFPPLLLPVGLFCTSPRIGPSLAVRYLSLHISFPTLFDDFCDRFVQWGILSIPFDPARLL